MLFLYHSVIVWVALVFILLEANRKKAKKKSRTLYLDIHDILYIAYCNPQLSRFLCNSSVFENLLLSAECSSPLHSSCFLCLLSKGMTAGLCACLSIYLKSYFFLCHRKPHLIYFKSTFEHKHLKKQKTFNHNCTLCPKQWKKKINFLLLCTY